VADLSGRRRSNAEAGRSPRGSGPCRPGARQPPPVVTPAGSRYFPCASSARHLSPSAGWNPSTGSTSMALLMFTSMASTPFGSVAYVLVRIWCSDCDWDDSCVAARLRHERRPFYLGRTKERLRSLPGTCRLSPGLERLRPGPVLWIDLPRSTELHSYERPGHGWSKTSLARNRQSASSRDACPRRRRSPLSGVVDSGDRGTSAGMFSSPTTMTFPAHRLWRVFAKGVWRYTALPWVHTTRQSPVSVMMRAS